MPKCNQGPSSNSKPRLSIRWLFTVWAHHLVYTNRLCRFGLLEALCGSKQDQNSFLQSHSSNHSLKRIRSCLISTFLLDLPPFGPSMWSYKSQQSS